MCHLKPGCLLDWPEGAVLVGKSSADRTLMKLGSVSLQGTEGRSPPGEATLRMLDDRNKSSGMLMIKSLAAHLQVARMLTLPFNVEEFQLGLVARCEALQGRPLGTWRSKPHGMGALRLQELTKAATIRGLGEVPFWQIECSN